MARYRVQIMDIFYFFSFVHSFLSTWFGHTTVLELSVTSIVRNQWISLTRKEQLNLWRWHFFSEQQANDHSEQQANDHHEPGVKARCFRPAQLAGKLQMTITYRGRVGFQGLVFPDCPTPQQVADDPSLTREEPAQPGVDHHLPGKSR